MYQSLYYVSYTVFVITLILTIYYSFKYRRKTSAKERGLFSARMNISMGIMLISIFILQILMFSGSTLRVIFGVICLLMGLFNLFAGLRNHAFFTRMTS